MELKQYSTREWLLTILIILMGVIILHGISYEFGASQRALGYVSFAGTIVSILLGLIAILYSFVQSVTQHNSVAEIKNQVSKLLDAGDEIVRSKDELNSSSRTLSDIVVALNEKMSETIGATDRAVAVFKEHNAFQGHIQRADGNGPEANKTSSSVMNSTKTYIDLYSLLIGIGVRNRVATKTINEFVVDLSKKLGVPEQYLIGGYYAAAMVLEQEGRIEIVDYEDDDSNARFLGSKLFNEELSSVIEKTKESSDSELVDFWVLFDKSDFSY